MRGSIACAALVLVTATTGCGGSSGPPTTPTPPLSPSGQPPAAGSGLAGIALNGASDAPLQGVTVRVDGVGEALTGADGRFSISASGAEQMRAATITSGQTVERVTHLRAPGPDVRVPLIPLSLDLRAFDEMYRSGGSRLQRWTAAPRIVVQARVLKFTNFSDTEYVALPEVMSDADAAALLADLAYGLPQITGDTFTGFAAEVRETAAEGDRVLVSRPDTIVVARYEGLTAGSNYWGYGRWASSGGAIVRGIVMIDRGFDTSGSPYRRSLRVHELGHALGYNHVTVRDSVMNSHARFEPNAFDRDSSRLAFLRPPLNRTPDIDPDPYSLNLRAGGELVWSGAR